MSDLHAAIMNIRCAKENMGWANSLEEFMHDQQVAKHAAAELAIASDARIEALEAALQKIAIWQSHSSELSVDYGSNGVRDFYRLIATQALKGQS